MKVSVLVLNYNGGDMNARCLAALARQTFRDFEVILIDNASTDGSFEKVTHLCHPERSEGSQAGDPSALGLRMTLLPLPANTGFAGGNNAGAKLAKGEWLVLLNNDAFPDPDWLERLVHVAEAHPHFDFFTSRQYCYNEPHLLDGTGDCLATNGRAWRRDYRVPAHRATKESGEVFGACAAAAMYRKADFDEVGGFDERFFCHFEDVDLSFRLRLMGKRCLYVPEAVVYHIGSATVGGERSDFALYQGMRNSVWCYVKCIPSGLLWKHLPRFLWKNLLDLVYQTLGGNGHVAFRAKRDALLGLPAILKTRRAVQASALVESEDIAAWVVRDPGHARPEETENATEISYA